ncbi:para-aminobenzoate synthase [Punctularia strigosozonata HHB-11173 SS5]|uniref:para-aminobenzoate synthase n=1 Tax=Punctularia strigosozonata (strain HHB-11173) TaxID=741275 RepID=UPI000441814E|nr:para-aminobenzoate synthase [Punctularia strigosozonata HHB-11173 SS5]EIN13940.1 para-aminobenzoate synthase [Punctularia strigosozonata HHB-11173 SS5]
MGPIPPRILLIDSYDSFTLNLASLLRRTIPGCLVHIVKNDQLPSTQLVASLLYFDAIVVGPGPGSPHIPSDIGVIGDIWNLQDGYLLPIFGVCLGLQALAVNFGARLKRLAAVKHGQISSVKHRGTDLYAGVGEVLAVRYHSLHVELLDGGEVTELAWTDEGDGNGRVVMAIKHRTKPFYAVQYHPESAKTEGGGAQVMDNFWKLAQIWTSRCRRTTKRWDPDAHDIFGDPWPLHKLAPVCDPVPPAGTVQTTTLDMRSLSVPRLCEELGVEDETSPFVLLDSAANPGRYVILGVLDSTTMQITFHTGERSVQIRENGKCRQEAFDPDVDVWDWLSIFMRRRKFAGGAPEIPFWGGLVGYLSYELGVASLGVNPDQKSPHPHPDVNLVYVERSLVFDNNTHTLYVQSLLPNDCWIDEMSSRLRSAQLHDPQQQTRNNHLSLQVSSPRIFPPDKSCYISAIQEAQENLFAGNSYELCLTAQTRIRLSKEKTDSRRGTPNRLTSWAIYKSLRERNPAPYSAYLRLGRTHFLSSSPERFLSYGRSPSTPMQLRPIKGTLRRTEEITREVAEQQLTQSKKEVAENLMIVDLIRHDLHYVLGEDVWVAKFCDVEEYETVWQMVSVIEGRSQDSRDHHGLGWEVLRRSLPPGSMTGAPKKRSVEILQTLESEARGIYSGVFGYWCVSGAGDWAVTIRSCYKFDCTEPGESRCRDMGAAGRTCENKDTPEEEWIIGAGGAITALSDPQAEWEEMLLKLDGVLSAFGGAIPPSG